MPLNVASTWPVHELSPPNNTSLRRPPGHTKYPGRQLATGIRLAAALILPAAIGYAVLARPIVQLVLEHGRLSHEAALTTGDTLALFALGLPGFSLYLLLIAAFQAMQDTRTMFVLYLIENGINVVVALALFPTLHVPGLALSYTVAYLVAAAVAMTVLTRRVGGGAAGLSGAAARVTRRMVRPPSVERTSP